MNSTWTPSATILSVDGVGAFDLVPLNAMLQGLMGMDGGDRILPFVRMFYGGPSTFLWEDDLGTTFCKERVGNKAIPSCPCCLRL